MRLFSVPGVSTNPEVHGAIIEAASLLRTYRREGIEDALLVCALTRVGSVAHALAAIGVDGARARERVTRLMELLPPRSWLTISTRFGTALREAGALAQRAGLSELDGPFFLAALLAHPVNAPITRALDEIGFSLLAYRWRLAHGDAAATHVPDSGLVQVVLHNDPFTTMELVLDVLQTVFEHDEATARPIMLQVHQTGSAPVAQLDAREAASKLDILRSRANASSMPLRVTVSVGFTPHRQT